MRLKPDTPAMTVLLAFMTAIGPLTMDIYLASMPDIGMALHASTAAVQLTLSFYLIGFAIGQLLYGPISDAYGRRPLLLIGFTLYLVATGACAFASTIDTLIVARMVQAIGSSGPIILARAIVRDLHVGTRAARQLGLMSAIMGVTPICAPVLGGFLQAWFGWRSSFFAMGTLGFVLALAALLLLPETNTRRGLHAPSVRGILYSFGVVARNGAYRSYLAMLAIIYIGVFAFLSGSSHVLEDVFGFSSIGFGFTYAMCSISYISGTYLGTHLVSRRGLEGMIGLGAALVLSGGLLQVLGYWLLPRQFLALIIPEMLYYLGSAFMVPQLIACALVPFPERAGAASSLMGFAQMTSASAVGAAMGAALGLTAWPLVSVMGLAAVASFTVFRTTASVRHQSLADPALHSKDAIESGEAC